MEEAYRANYRIFPTRVGVNRPAPAERVMVEIFPTRVGVNRFTLSTVRKSTYFPHACGGEPVSF